jgi:hypothetical protein
MDRPDFALTEQRLGKPPCDCADFLGISPSTWRKLKRGETWKKGVPPAKEPLVRQLMERAGKLWSDPGFLKNWLTGASLSLASPILVNCAGAGAVSRSSGQNSPSFT